MVLNRRIFLTRLTALAAGLGLVGKAMGESKVDRSPLFCRDCAAGDTARLIDGDGTACTLSGEPGEMAHAYEDGWWICVAAYTHESALSEISRLMDMDLTPGGPDANKLVALTDAVRAREIALYGSLTAY